MCACPLEVALYHSLEIGCIESNQFHRVSGLWAACNGRWKIGRSSTFRSSKIPPLILTIALISIFNQDIKRSSWLGFWSHFKADLFSGRPAELFLSLSISLSRFRTVSVSHSHTHSNTTQKLITFYPAYRAFWVTEEMWIILNLHKNAFNQQKPQLVLQYVSFPIKQIHKSADLLK